MQRFLCTAGEPPNMIYVLHKLQAFYNVLRNDEMF